MDEAEWRMEVSGLTTIVRITNRDIFVREVVLHFTIFRCKAMIDQFIEGLRYYDVSLKVYFAILETHTSKRVWSHACVCTDRLVKQIFF